MYKAAFLFILCFLLNKSVFIAQTNVGGTITSDQTWTLSGSPYSVTNTLTIRNGATLTIERGVLVSFPGSSQIYVGYSSSSSGYIVADGVEFTSTYTSDSRIYIRYGTSEGSFNNCSFNNVYLSSDGMQLTVNSCYFDNTNYPVVLLNEAKINASGISFGENNTHNGIEWNGTINNNYLLQNIGVHYFVDGVTVKNGSTLTIENGVNINFPGSVGFYVGYSSTSTGSFIANNVLFNGLSSSDAQILFRANSTGEINNCTLKNAYLNLDNASPSIRNCKFSKCVNALYLRNNASPTIQNNDFFNNTVALKNSGTNTVSAENNYWGHSTGPLHTNNAGGLGQEIEGNASFQPFNANPINGFIEPEFTVEVVEVTSARVGSYKETEVTFLTSIGNVDLLVTEIQSDISVFTIKSSTTFWVAEGDTPKVKIRFTPNSAIEYHGNLLLYTNYQEELVSIPVTSVATSYLSLSTDSLNFGVVNLKDYKSIKLLLKNESSSSLKVDSIVSTNPNFNYVVGAYPLNVNENVSPNDIFSMKENRLLKNTAAGFYIPGKDSEEVLITYHPKSIIEETGQLKIYYSSVGVEAVSLFGEGYSAPISINITGINFQNFPFIYLNAIAETYGVQVETLTKSNFRIYENGILQESHYDVTAPGQGEGSRLADIIFIMDNSGSLSDERDSVAENVTNFVNSLATSGVDYAIGLCRFGSSEQGGDPIIEDNGMLTSDVEYFKNNLWTRNVTGGGTEPGYLAIKQSATYFTFRPGAQKIFIIITDETPDQGDGTLNDAIASCMNNSITLFALTYTDLFYKFTPITEATHGSVHNITSDFSDILSYISEVVTNNYVLEYSSSSPEFDNQFREVVIEIEYQGNTNADTVYYNPLSLPIINRTTETVQLHEKAWAQYTAFNIKATITDEYEPYVKNAKVYFRITGTATYYYVTMTSEGNDIYSAIIPQSVAQPPGIDYYITASDSISTTSDPKTNTGFSPYQLAILPNVAPAITHTPVGFAQLNSEILIEASIEDNTNNLAGAVLNYRKTGQLSYQNVLMNSLGSNNFSASIPVGYITRSGVEYYIKATDDFNLSNFDGTIDAPHKISVGAVVVNAQVDTLAVGPSIKNVIVPSNGAGYCYFNINYMNSPINSGSSIIAKLWVGTDLFETEGVFISPGLLRIKIPSYIVLDSAVEYTLANQISIGDTIYSFNGSSFQINVTKVPSEFVRTWDVFASGSAGVSGTVGSVGAGASAAAAKLSVKGTAGAGLTIQKDQDANVYLDRRLEASVAVGLEVPSLNVVGAKATVGSASITVKTLLGQQFCFTDLSVDEDTKKMAQAGFMLETFSIAGVGLSPIVGPILQAIITVLNNSAGITPVFDQAHLTNYWGIGLEGSIGAGFNIKAQSVNLNTLNASSSIALNLKFEDYFKRSNRKLYKSFLANSVGKSIELNEAVSFNFSAFDFGLKKNDKVELTGGNFSLFDAGGGTSITATADFDNGNNFEGLTVAFTGGGGYAIFGSAKDIYYTTEFEFPKEYKDVLLNAGSSLTGFFLSTREIPLGSDLINVAAQSFKNAFSNIKPSPLRITTLEKRGKGYTLDLNIDLDAALLVGLGVSLGITAKYYDDIEFPRKVTDVYWNGENYLLYTSNYYSDMESDQFNSVVYDLMSGTLPLVKEAFENIMETVKEIVVAGVKYVISAISDAGDTIGEVAGNAQEAGSWVVSHVSSWLPMSYQYHQFEKPVFKKMYYSARVMHPINRSGSKLMEVDSKLVLVSESMIVNFIKDGESTSLDSVSEAYKLKMVIKDNILLENNFTPDDKEKVKLYYYDDNLLNWILLGGTRSADSIIVSTNKLGAFALGIEVSSMQDNTPPSILDYGPVPGSTLTNYPEIYISIQDDLYGSGLDLSRTYLILNGDTLDYTFDPSQSKVYYQLSASDCVNYSTVQIHFICTDLAGNVAEENYQFTLDVTGINDEDAIPKEFKLYQNYPNPFNPATTISFDTPKKTSVEINIYDIKGSFVGSLYSGKVEAGHHSITWKGVNQFGSPVASGIYFYQIITPEFNKVKKMQVIK